MQEKSAKSVSGTIGKLQEKLRNHPDLRYSVGERKITVFPADALGFTVRLEVRSGGFTVGFDGWHEEFSSEQEALNAFAFGLSDQCRLKVVRRGEMDCSWTLEFLKEGDWVVDSSVGLLLTPFWRKKSVEYRQNHLKF